MGYGINTDFTGGNCIVDKILNDTVYIRPDMRDSGGDWFYWAFCVIGAGGKTLTFDFQNKSWVGPFGPAVSTDLSAWHWDEGLSDGKSFTYTFGQEEDKVFFAHDLLYHPARFDAFALKNNIPVNTLCQSAKNLAVPIARFGEGDKTVLLTARHHCCESTGSYMLEGALDYLYHHPLPGWRVVAIPFVDIDGVMAGDQGKNRIPHDHNRDYNEKPLYTSVQAIQKYISDNKVCLAFDFHSPWHTGGLNDKVFIVRSKKHLVEQKLFGSLFENNVSANALRYATANDLDPGVGWNVSHPEDGLSFAGFCATQNGVELVCTLETPYFGEKENMVTQDNLLESGKCFAKAIGDYIAAQD